MGFAEAMILEYNGKKKTNAGRLYMNKLYSKDHGAWGDIEDGDDDDETDEYLGQEELPYEE